MFFRLVQVGTLLLLALSGVSCAPGQPAAEAAVLASPTPWNAAPLATSASLTPSGADLTAGRADVPVSLDPVVIWSQPPKPGGGLVQSSYHDPDGGPTDRFVWENFGFENAQTVSEVRWRGGYDPALDGSGVPVHAFTVDIFQSIPAGSEPDLAVAPLVHYRIDGNAEETPAEVLGGVQTYDYRFELPVPFKAAAATTYWLQIEAFQAGKPDWGLSIGGGTLGDGRHFRGRADGYYYQLILEDMAVALVAPVVEGVAPVAEVAASQADIEAMLANLPPPEEVPVNAEGIQEVMLVVSRSGYTPLHFAVKAGTPVRLIFRQLGYVPGGNELLVRWGERQQSYLILASPTDTKVLNFTPQEPGEFRFSCPHDWYEGVMTVQG